jgi:hypothetical protein
MMPTTADIASLCAAIDAGDAACLPILADALEEAGDPRAAGLRRSKRPGCSVGHYSDYGWYYSYVVGCGGITPPTYYPTRHEAFLALAAALADV